MVEIELSKRLHKSYRRLITWSLINLYKSYSTRRYLRCNAQYVILFSHHPWACSIHLFQSCWVSIQSNSALSICAAIRFFPARKFVPYRKGRCSYNFHHWWVFHIGAWISRWMSSATLFLWQDSNIGYGHSQWEVSWKLYRWAGGENFLPVSGSLQRSSLV